MSLYLSKEINKLKKLMSELSTKVEDSMKQAVYATVNNDLKIAKEVIKNDKVIDELEIELEEECLKILALHQPVAIDLRYVVACLKMNNDLERIGDLSASIAKNVKYVSEIEHLDSFKQNFLGEMMELAQMMLKNSLDALFNLDKELAEKVCSDDDAVDDLNDRNHQIALEEIKKTPENSRFFLKLLGMSRNIERIADYSTNIAEDIIYMINGNIVRHQ